MNAFVTGKSICASVFWFMKPMRSIDSMFLETKIKYIFLFKWDDYIGKILMECQLNFFFFFFGTTPLLVKACLYPLSEMSLAFSDLFITIAG